MLNKQLQEKYVDKLYIEQIKKLYTAYVKGEEKPLDVEDVYAVEINTALFDVLSNVNFAK
jgi:hypothetical protein